MPSRGKGGKKILKPKQKTVGKIKQPDYPKNKSDLERFPKFSFKRLSNDFNLNTCDKNQKAALVEKLRILGALQWRTINVGGKDGNGYEMIPIEQIRGRKDTLTADVTKVMVFRFNGKKCRLVGDKVGATFYIVWIDPKLDLYDH